MAKIYGMNVGKYTSPIDPMGVSIAIKAKALRICPQNARLICSDFLADTLYHIISHRGRWYILYYIKSYRAILHHVMSYHVILYHIMSCHIMLSCIISCHVISCHVMSCYLVSCHVISCHLVPCHIISCYLASCHIISYHIMY